MDKTEFSDRMPSLDKELSDKGIPIHARAFHAFPLLTPDYNGPLLGYGIDSSVFNEYEGPNLLEKVEAWFQEIYGDRVYSPTDRGKVPILIKQEIYLIRIPLVYGSPEIEILPLVNGLTNAMARILSVPELNEIQRRFIEGYGLTYEFEDLSSQMDTEEKNVAKTKDNPFLMSALRDKGTAADCLEGSVDTNGAVFHSQQLAEKMLKAVIFSTGLSEDDIRRKYNHRINDVFKDISSHNVAPSTVDSAVKLISQYKMGIRYSVDHLPKNESIEAFWAGLRIGGWCATILSGHDRRV